MATKFDAAEIAAKARVDTYVANGRADNALARTLSGEIGTHFIA